MTEEKKNLMKTLKDENLRAETRKFTRDLINTPKTSRSFISSNNKHIHSIFDNHNNNIEVNNDMNKNINNSEKGSIKKKKKIKKKKNVKDGENVLKPGEAIKQGQKYKLLIKTNLNEEKNNEEIKDEKKEEKPKNDNNNINKENNENKIKKEKETKPIIKDKEKKSNKTRRDLLNSLNNLQYNFDNLMEIGVHGTKVLNNNKK